MVWRRPSQALKSPTTDDPAGVRRPDREVHAVGALVMDQVRAHLVEEPQVAAFADVVVVHRPEHRAEGIGVGHPPLAAGVAGAVLERLALADVERPLEEAGVVAAGQGAGGLVVEGEGLELGRRRRRRRGRPACRRPPAAPSTAKGSPCEPATMASIAAGVEQAGTGARRRLARFDGLLGHRRLPPASFLLGLRLQADAPDVFRILPDGAVRREPAHPRGVQDRLLATRPTDRTRARPPRAGRWHRRRSRSPP